MDAPFPGVGTLVNVVLVLVGSLAGMSFGHRLPERVRAVVTDCLGLVTLLIAALSALAVTEPSLEAAVGTGVPVLIVLGSLLIGGIVGSLLQIERRMEGLAGVIQAYVARRAPRTASAERGAGELSPRERFIEGWLTTSLLFCVGPLTILGSLNDGLGRGVDQLVLKSVLDCFAAMAFASTFGVGVLFSAVSVAVVQGSLTVVGVLLGSVFPDAQIQALTAVGGLLLVGVGLRLLRMKDIPVGDLLPALAVAPVLVWVVGSLT
ncbi:DUF554 domain-containing protein [Ornithinicoccus hortensis]|uniref:Membrane protein YdfK n=1 Tax=Ornithinicoccus hortensis TaxID=82346 RepID=A0A542YSL6_9MICO|nr:DUF554 domain-containing protein [Ornithinicoccus hortensis]TQL51068.1 hypothetical protein FB467_2202 [Ornithinicoccus hortensis]